MRPLDVTAEQQRKHDELVRRLSDGEKGAILDGLIESGRQLARIGIKQRHPGATDALVEWLLIENLYGASVALRLRGQRPAQ